jgi:eukaryotic-like serine/threonine-protein kinase
VSLTAGTRIGVYEVQSVLGAGGMGQVYRAHDTRLGRDVALKILPEAFASDPERLMRFEREAKTLAALNHPHIAQIYGVEDRAIVMELVDGEDLAKRLARGALPLEEALPIARQVADALRAAHEQGIVHRDLKPANVRVRPDGTVKVLDFGLAKAMDAGAGESRPELADSPTITSPAMTAMGVILGTAPYMAPEQARGGTVDRRADLWAFGCLFFEMITGRRAFLGDSVSETITAVMRDEPDWQLLPAGLSPATERFLRRCFAKHPRERVQDAGDLRLALDGAFDAPSPAGGPSSSAAWWMRPGLIAAAILATSALAGTAGWWLRPEPASAEAPIRRFTVSTAPADLLIAGVNRDLAISPDGTLLVYKVKGGSGEDLYVRRLDSLAPTTLLRSAHVFEPFISPDGRWVGFLDEAVRPWTLRKVPATGGPPVAIVTMDDELLGASWGDDDTIVYSTGGSLWRVPAAGGTPQRVLEPDTAGGELGLAWPTILPGSRTVLYAVRYGGRFEDWTIHAVELQTGKTKVLLRGATNPLYSQTGHLLYMVGPVLYAVRFDASRVETQGDSLLVLEGVLAKGSGCANVVLGSDGTLAYVSGGVQMPARRDLAWLDRRGGTEPLGLPPGPYSRARISPDGTRIAVEVHAVAGSSRTWWGEGEVWVWDLARRVLSRVTTLTGADPVWAPDSRSLLFASSREGPRGLFLQSADGTGEARRLHAGAYDAYPSGLTPDGQQVIFRRQADTAQISVGEEADLMIAPSDGSGAPVPLVARGANGEVSPDARWLAYESDETGPPEVYVRPFPDVARGRWQISYGGGRQPMWGRDSRELFFIDADGRLSAVRVGAGPGFSASPPARISDIALYVRFGGRTSDISPDGRRFLVIQDLDEAPRTPSSIVVVDNWTLELKRLAAR